MGDSAILLPDSHSTVESIAHLLLTVADLQTYPNPLQDNPAYSVVK